jgi:peptidoglycan hydrolase-like protein with peptidoglycan-binding domain
MAEVPPTVKRGSHGEAVKGLQNALRVRGGGASVAVDGDFGPATENAVRQFQTGNGLAADGIAGPATWAALHVYPVQRGDTLSGIAEQELGDADRWPEIHDLNKTLVSNPDRISAGQVLTMPL